MILLLSHEFKDLHSIQHAPDLLVRERRGEGGKLRKRKVGSR